MRLLTAFFTDQCEKFLLQTGAAGLRQAEVGAVFMTVPEAAVDEEDGAVLGQDEVGFSGQGPVFRAADGEAVAEAV